MKQGWMGQARTPARRSGLAPSATGRALRASDRSYFEGRFGQDFSQVRVHTGPAAAAMTDVLGAKALAAGDDIAFDEGRYQPDSAHGRELLAHELAHVAQQRAGGSGAPAQAEHRARQASQTAARGGEVSPQALGGASPGIYCDDDSDKKPEEVPPSVLPPMPNLTLQPPPAIDWMKIRQTYDVHGSPMSPRDGDSLSQEWQRSSRLLDTLGINDRFKFLFIDKNWILNKGLQLQLEDRLMREDPNRMDRWNREWKDSHPGSWQTPMVPIFDIDWFRSKKK